MNINRVRTQGAAVAAAGVRAGMADGELPEEWFDGVCGHPEQVDLAMTDENMNRAARRMAARMGGR